LPFARDCSRLFAHGQWALSTESARSSFADRRLLVKVVAALGNPRLNGNSATLAKRFCESAEKLGAEVQTFALRELDYSGCVACMGCKITSETCVVQDDMAQVLDAVVDADMGVLATPIYYGDVSSQTKGFIGRTFPFLKPGFATNPNPGRLLPGKTLVFVQTQGWDESHFGEIFGKYQLGFKRDGFGNARLIRRCGFRGPDATAKRDDLVSLVEETGKKTMA
jgi:putative NADPH-quinone reductase